MAKTVKCKSCGAVVDAPGMYCSSTFDLICQGREFVPGCGTILTPEERHYYGTSCERCETEWSDHMEDWRRGRIKDAKLDEMYGSPAARLQ